MKVVDDYLSATFKPGVDAKGLYSSYTAFGEDPFISGEPPEGQQVFSAWDYAKRRCEELCGGRGKRK